MQTGIKHHCAFTKAPPRDPEPRFDAERVVWDAYYRRRVIDRLRDWRQRHAERSGGASANAA